MRHIQAIFSFIFNYKRTSRKEILGKVFHNIVVFNTTDRKKDVLQFHNLDENHLKIKQFEAWS